MGHRVGENFVLDPLELLVVQGRVDGHDVHRAHTVDGDAKVVPRLAAQAFAFGIEKLGL